MDTCKFVMLFLYWLMGGNTTAKLLYFTAGPLRYRVVKTTNLKQNRRSER